MTDGIWVCDSPRPKPNLKTHYIKSIETKYVLDSTVCDSTFEQTLTDESGKTFYVNLELECNKYFHSEPDTVWAEKITLKLSQDEYDIIMSLILREKSLGDTCSVFYYHGRSRK